MQEEIANLWFRIRWEWWQQKVWTFGSLWVARKLPRWLRYWVTIDSIARATTGKYSDTVVPELRAMDVLGRI